MSNDLTTEQYIHTMDELMQGKMKYASFQYEPVDTGGIRASLSWHLTPSEIAGIEGSLESPDNKALFETVANWLRNDAAEE
jgi:hypothetical protein